MSRARSLPGHGGLGRPWHGWSRARLLVCVTAMSASTALASCGVPTGGGAQPISRQAVPFGLLTPSSSPTNKPAPGDVRTQVYLVKNGHLAAEVRFVRPPGSLQRTLEALLQGPTYTELAYGLESAIPNQTTLQSPPALSPSLVGDVATLNLGGNFGQVSGQQEVLAVAQLVFTATAFPGVSAVNFELDGKPVQVPIGNGQLTPASTPLSPSDFSPQAPQS